MKLEIIMPGIFILDERNIPKINICKYEFDGNKIRDFEALYIELKNAMCFPPHFNGNFNSLDECLNDLSWISENNDFEIKIKNIDSFLINEKEDDIKTFFEILRDIDLNCFKNNKGNNIQNIYIVLERTNKSINILEKIGVKII